ncbi:MAG: DEAD/DEAH box helicase family protein, partial [Actinomycetota bacterium]|nr:DEAD/DEAH box helicase family protein [Actinomycetota bacterium]
MPLDFRKLTTDKHLDTLTSPRDIFTALPSKAPGFGYLRDVQGQVLDAWEKRRTERDLALKMNTGGGKTIVGLLILQSCLNEGIGPALYVAPNTYLAVQVGLQATKLGIRTVDDPDSVKYLSGEAIGVVNVHKLINGRSVFGGPGGRPTPLPIGAVVVDDVHAAIAETEAQSTLVVPTSHPAYSRIREKFADDLKRQSESTYLDIEADVPSAVMRVPFWAWADRSSDVTAILHEHREDGDLVFTWPLVSDVLSISQAVFTASALEVRPPMPPVKRITSLAEARRRIYLTATLADDSVLVTHFDANAQAVEQPITPITASDLGDRMILAPQEINPSISDDEIRHALRQLANRINVVVLVPSHRRADEWAGVANLTAAADSIAIAVEQLQSGHVGLVVLVNKYDGIDLPEDACRILVIDGLPEAYGGIERREAVLLGETDAMVGRQLQRIEQGMGRGVRSADDYCVVLLLGSRLSQLIAIPANASKLGPATRAQLDLSRQIASQLEGQSLAEMVDVIRQALDRDADWVKASRAALAGVTYATAGISPLARNVRAAYDAAEARQYQVAVNEMSDAVNAVGDVRVKGWLQEQLAVYQHQLDPARAQQTLAGAVRD